jgi:hypothetical protein
LLMRPRGTKVHPGDTVQMGAYIQQQPGIVSFVLKCATFQDDNEDTPPTLKENAMLCKTKIEKQVGGFFASTPSLLPPRRMQPSSAVPHPRTPAGSGWRL